MGYQCHGPEFKLWRIQWQSHLGKGRDFKGLERVHMQFKSKQSGYNAGLEVIFLGKKVVVINQSPSLHKDT